MSPVEFIEYKDLKILRIEFGGELSNERIAEIMDQAKQIIAKQPPASLRTLTIFGEFHFDTVTANLFKEYVAHNKPYVKAGAVIGIYGLRKALYNSLMIVTHRRMRICENEEKAREYLASSID